MLLERIEIPIQCFPPPICDELLIGVGDVWPDIEDILPCSLTIGSVKEENLFLKTELLSY